ncbi:MAG TPA: dephospho-CoA kinase [Rhizomicrobium sp.]|nr:dephospho-CoA kinase [Rhizomicrobium sp.]
MKRPLIIGLTGSIGMGKTETAKMFAKLGVPVYDSDAAVHRLYEKGGAAVAEIEKAFPGTVVGGAVDREKLSAIVTADKARLKQLEKIVHPLVAQGQGQFLQDNAGAEMVVFDIPLLYETGAEARLDAVVVVSAPSHIQRARVLARPGMTAEKLDSILERQMSDAEKRAKAHFVIATDKGLDHAFEQVKTVVAALKERHRSDA